MSGLEDTRASLLRVERLNLTLSAGAVAASFALFSPEVAGSVATGAGLEVLNFRSLHGAARSFFAGEMGGSRLWMGVAALRLAVLMGAIAVALVLGAHPAALVVGLSMVLPATVIDAWRHRPPVLDPDSYPGPPVPPPDDPAWDRFSVWRFERMDEEPRHEDDDWTLAAPSEDER